MQGKLEAKRKDIEKLQEREKAVHQAFLQSLGDNNKFADYLTKVFRKKIKRTKKKTTEGEGTQHNLLVWIYLISITLFLRKFFTSAFQMSL